MVLLLALALNAFGQTPAMTGMERMGPVSAEHTGGDLGVGIAVGAPTGIAVKLWLEEWTAVQFSAGGALGQYNDIAATADYLLQFRPFDVGDPEVSVQVHLGPGIHVGGNTAAEMTGRWLVGPRGVGGFSIMKRDMPFDIYMEIAPTIYLVDGAGWSMNGQIGLRNYM